MACFTSRLIAYLIQAFAGAVRFSFPNHLRLSIHKSTGEHKISMSLLNTKTGFTTPWHCSVALMADGEWISAMMSDFKKDPRLEIIYENDRPSYFRENIGKLHESDNDKKSRTIQQGSERSNGYSEGHVFIAEAAAEKSVKKVDEKIEWYPSTSASSSIDTSESFLAEPRRPLSYEGVKYENGKSINSF